MKRDILIFIDKFIINLVFPVFFFIAIFEKKKINDLIIRNPKNILIIRQGGIGDIIHTRPLILVLKKYFPDLKITILCENRAKHLIKYLNLADDLIIMDKIGLVLKNLNTLLISDFDAVIDLGQKRKISAILSFITQSKCRIGYDVGYRRFLYTHLVSYAHKEYEAESIFKILRYFDIEEEFDFDLFKIKTELNLGTIKKFNLKEKSIVIGFNALNLQNCSSIEEERAIIEYLIENTDYNLIFLGTFSEKRKIKHLLQGLDNRKRIFNLAGKTNIEEVIDIINFADKFIGYDAGLLHIAAALDKELIGIFGPSILEKWHAFKYDSKFKYVYKNLVCQPCVLHRFPDFLKCPYDKECLKNIKDEVIKKLINH